MLVIRISQNLAVCDEKGNNLHGDMMVFETCFLSLHIEGGVDLNI